MVSKKPAPLAREERAVVRECLFFWRGQKWCLRAFTVKPTHVHIIAQMLPAAPDLWYSFSEVLHSVKRRSSRSINRTRGRRGPQWETESYDHMVRDDEEFDFACNYLLQNAAEEVPGEDPYNYDGFWCEGLEATAPEPAQVPLPLSRRPVAPRLAAGQFVKHERKLPHWEEGGATYHIVVSLLGYEPREESPWPEDEEWKAQRKQLRNGENGDGHNWPGSKKGTGSGAG